MATRQDSTATKRCGTCKQVKPLTEFGNRGDRPCGKRAVCKPCANEYNRKYFPEWRKKPENRAREAAHGARHYRENREKILARHKEWRKNNPEIAKKLGRKSVLRAEYGLTPEQVAVMFGRQEGRCAICAVILRPGTHTHIDHCHKTGKIRALLCGGCNRGIGCMRDDAARIRKAADYIEFHQ